MAPRIVNMLLGVWLFVSALVWPHSWAQRAIALVFGVVAFAFALAGLYRRPFRYVNALIGAFLVVFAVLVPHARAATPWNELLVGLAMLVTSLVPGHGVELSAREQG